MTDESSIGARGFISYHRRDNDDFDGVVDQLKSELEGKFHAATGRQLEIFLDREAIGWGADWRGRIRESVKSATFFIPIVTMRYFESAVCREELLAFYENANQLGVTELILPIVLTGADAITDEDPRDEVRIIERLNYKNLEAAFLAGYDSPEWRQTIHAMVIGLKAELAVAENALADQESSAVETAEAGEDQDSVDADVTALGADLTQLTVLTTTLAGAIKGFGDAAQRSTEGGSLSGVPPKQQQAVLVRMARELSGPANELSEVGSEFESRVFSTDARLRAVIEEMRTIDADIAQKQLEELWGAVSGLQALSEMVSQMSSLVQMLRFAAVANMSVRKSVQPAIKGFQSIGNALATVDTWRAI